MKKIADRRIRGRRQSTSATVRPADETITNSNRRILNHSTSNAEADLNSSWSRGRWDLNSSLNRGRLDLNSSLNRGRPDPLNSSWNRSRPMPSTSRYSFSQNDLSSNTTSQPVYYPKYPQSLSESSRDPLYQNMSPIAPLHPPWRSQLPPLNRQTSELDKWWKFLLRLLW